MSFGHGEKNRVILRLRATLQNSQLLAGIERGGGDDSKQLRLRYMVRARAADQNTTGLQQPERSQIDFFVAADCAFKSGPGFGECGRVNDNDVVLPASGNQIG